MDGAFSSYSYDLKLFSTAALRETPEAVTQLHADYIDAGCDIITTAS
jgi:S-methylmethionine-dependent homocysteine/selenocysteine methylase